MPIGPPSYQQTYTDVFIDATQKLTPTQELCDAACILSGKEPPNRQPDQVPDFMGTLAERMAASLETHFWEQPSSLYDKLKSRMK